MFLKKKSGNAEFIQIQITVQFKLILNLYLHKRSNLVKRI